MNHRQVVDVTEGTADRLKDAAHTARVRLEGAAAQAAGQGRKAAETARERFDEASARARAWHSRVRTRSVGEVEDELISNAKRHPGRLLAMVAAAGLAAGLLLRRR